MRRVKGNGWKDMRSKEKIVKKFGVSERSRDQRTCNEGRESARRANETNDESETHGRNENSTVQNRRK